MLAILLWGMGREALAASEQLGRALGQQVGMLLGREQTSSGRAS